MIDLPWGTYRNKRGEVLSTAMRARIASTRETRRRRMYDLMALHSESAATILARVRKRRIRDPMPHLEEDDYPTGGKIPWKYVPKRVAKMYQRHEINAKQLRAAGLYCYLYQLDWLLTAPGTNFPKGEKVMSSMQPKRPWAGSTFPIHAVEKRYRDVLEAGLIRDVSFKALPGVVGGSRITKHRTGRSAFLSALSAFHRVLSTVLTN